MALATQWLLVLLLLATLAVVGKAWRDTMADPQLHWAQVTLAGTDAHNEPIKMVLLADIHVAGPDMPPSRLALLRGSG